MRGQVKAVVSTSKRACPCLDQIEHSQIARCESCSPAGSHGIQDCPRWAAVVCSGCCVQLWFEQNCVGAENPVRAGRVQLQLKSRAIARHPGGPKGATVHALRPSCGVQQRRVCLSQTRGYHASDAWELQTVGKPRRPRRPATAADVWATQAWPACGLNQMGRGGDS